MTSFSTLLVLLALVAVVSAGSGPVGFTCPNGFAISDPIAKLGQTAFQIGQNYQSPPSTWQFTGNLVHHNSNAGQLMGGGLEGPFFTVTGTGSWTPGGALDYAFDVFSDQARTKKIGTGSIHSDMFMTNPKVYAPDNSVITFAGGWVTLVTTITDTSSNNPGYGAHIGDSTYANFRPLNKMIYFQPLDSMPGVFPKPLMNRLISQAEAAAFPNPTYFTGAYTGNSATNTDYIMVLWGSDGYDSTKQAFTTPATGMDLVLKVSCDTSNPNPNDGGPVPTGPCPDGACSASFESNYASCAAPVSNPIVGRNPTGSCVTLSFTPSTLNCPR